MTDWWEDYDPAVDDRRAPDDVEDAIDDPFDDAVDEGHDSDRAEGLCGSALPHRRIPTFRPVEWGVWITTEALKLRRWRGDVVGR